MLEKGIVVPKPVQLSVFAEPCVRVVVALDIKISFSLGRNNCFNRDTGLTIGADYR